MNLSGILIYSGRAAAFAALVCGVYMLACLLRGRKPRAKRLAALAYLAALVQITVLRGGVNWAQLMQGGRSAAQLMPLRTTLGELGSGAWPFIYHTAGNLAWFMPLGMLMHRKPPLRTAAAGALLSAGIEICQYVLMTGMADIDDVLLNTLGAVLGWLLMKLLCGKEKRTAD